MQRQQKTIYVNAKLALLLNADLENLQRLANVALNTPKSAIPNAVWF